MSGSTRQKLALHGPIIELDCAVPAILPMLDSLLGKFAVPSIPSKFVPTSGIIVPYDHEQRQQRIPLAARQIENPTGTGELFQHEEQYWLSDSQWGFTEINFLRHQFRSWVHESSDIDPNQLTEKAVLWPIAQLLQRQGLHIVPAVSAVRDGFSVMIVSPFGLQPELHSMMSHGWRVIGQRWTALREEDGRVALLHIPGKTERSIASMRMSNDSPSRWVDLMEDRPSAWQSHAFCDAVLVVGDSRQSSSNVCESNSADAAGRLTKHWPMLEVPPGRHPTMKLEELISRCPCYRGELSRNPSDLLNMLNSLRYAGPATGRQIAAA